MREGNAFFDTNVVLYALSDEAWRKERVAERMSVGGVLSTQVLAESANVMRRKFGRSVAEIKAFHDSLLNVCRIQRIETATIRRALNIAERYGYSIYDSLIVGCRKLAVWNVFWTPGKWIRLPSTATRLCIKAQGWRVARLPWVNIR